MAWRHLAKPQTVKHTQALAEKYRDMEAAPHDRAIRESRLSFLKGAAESGNLRVAAYASAFCKETGTEYRVNGKHTANVLAEMNGSAPAGLQATIERYECDTLEDVARLYATFDPPKSARSANEIYQQFAGCDPLLEEINAKTISLCASGIGLGEWGNAAVSRSAEERASKMLENRQFVLFVDRLLNRGADSRHLRRAPVVAAMYLTWRKAPKLAWDFWCLVLTGEGSHPTTPDRVLQKWLIGSSLRGGNAGGKGGSKEMLAKCIHAWNAWRDGESTALKYYPDKPVPVVK